MKLSCEIFVVSFLAFTPLASPAAQLAGSVSSPAATFNLTAEGTVDWAHWGRGGTYGNFDHKASGGSLISNATPFGDGENHGGWHDNSRSASWTDGTPTASISGDVGYIWSNGAPGSGYSFTVPADTTIRTLFVYCGGNGEESTLQATLSDASAPDFVDAQSDAGIHTHLYAITYQAASAGQTLTINFTKTADITGTDGSADLKAAWLINGLPNTPPSITITAPTAGEIYTNSENLTVTANASDSDGTISKVEFYAGNALIGSATNAPYAATFNNAAAGRYTLTARATDNGGETTTSDPVNIFVWGNQDGSIISDDFHNSAVNHSIWQTVDPVGDGTIQIVGSGTSDSHLEIIVPAGHSHDAWVTDESLHLFQTVADQDFEVEAKFDSLPPLPSQFEGIMVLDPAGNFLRFDALNDGPSVLKAFIGSINGGNGAQISRTEITDVALPSIGNQGTIYLRVSREAGQWTFSTSPDGTNWTEQNSFPQDFAVAQVGVFAGNYSADNNPTAFTAEVDYFFNTASPISPEDGSSNQPPVISITAPLDATTLVAGSNLNITADASDSDGSVSKIEFYAGSTLIGIATQKPYSATWTNAGLGTYILTARATDNSGASRISPPVRISVTSGPNGAIVSDDFHNGSINQAVWRQVDPVGGGGFQITGASSGDGHLELGVPGGHSHDAWITDESLRLFQTVADQDFEIEAKFDSLPPLPSQFEGFEVLDPSGNYMRFDVLNDGPDVLKAFIAKISGGNGSQISRTPISDVPLPTNGTQGTIYIKLSRQAGQWTFSTSPDDTNWTEQNSFPQDWVLAQVGLFAGTYSADNNPQPFAAEVDYFFNTASPIVPEDGGGSVGLSASIHLAGSNIEISITPANPAATYTIEQTATLSPAPWTEVPNVTFTGQGTVLATFAKPTDAAMFYRTVAR